MSCNEWEKGQWTLSVAEFRTFRNRMADDFNRLQEKAFSDAKRIRDEVLRRVKGKRNPDEVHYAFHEVCSSSADQDRIYDVIFYKKGEKLVRPRNPQKKDFPKVARSKFTGCNVGYDASISLDPKTRVVVWEVSENNHAVDRSREHPLGNAFWRNLGMVKWTRGTGGRLWGSDEYRDEANREHGYGDDNTKDTWGTTESKRRRF